MRNGAGRVYFHRAGFADVTLIGPNDDVNTNEFGASQSVDIDTEEGTSGTLTGEIVGARWVSRESGTGSIFKAAFDLVVFSADPSLSAGTTTLTAAKLDSIVTIAAFTTGDYIGTLSAGAVGYKALAHPFITNGSGKVWIAPINRSSFNFNSAAADNEILKARLYFRRDN